MAAVVEVILGRGFLGEIVSFAAPLWGAVLVGLLLGWAWKPKWADLVVVGPTGGETAKGGVGGGETAGGRGAEIKEGFGLSSLPSFGSIKAHYHSCISWVSDEKTMKERRLSGTDSSQEITLSDAFRITPMQRDQSIVNADDFEHLWHLTEVTDGGPVCYQVMDKTTPVMHYKAWRRDPETGPPQYRSSTVYEDSSPELLRDFFWDDEFRAKWDDMLVRAATLEECPQTGTMIVHWVRKFPFFCSDREYAIGRRIWQSEGAYYCVTKGVPYPSLPRHSKPRRVDLYYSSWRIRAVESRRGDGQLTACEVLLFHHEDMGIPWEIAKLGVRQGMWGAVKTIERGIHAYKKSRNAGEPLSHSADMAHINTKVDTHNVRPMELMDPSEADLENPQKPCGSNIPRLLIVGGAVVLACSLDKGLLTKAVIFGVARRFAKIGRRL